jgi:hypothetical protein
VFLPLTFQAFVSGASRAGPQDTSAPVFKRLLDPVWDLDAILHPAPILTGRH